MDEIGAWQAVQVFIDLDIAAVYKPKTAPIAGQKRQERAGTLINQCGGLNHQIQVPFLPGQLQVVRERLAGLAPA